MNNIEEKNKNSDTRPREELGFRFQLFRKAIRKSAIELASELGVSAVSIHSIERGRTYPGIRYLHYLYNNYGLNINWLLTKRGHMFVEEARGKTEEKKELLYKKYAELLDLMQVPEVEQAINAALTQIRALLELERDDFPESG